MVKKFDFCELLSGQMPPRLQSPVPLQHHVHQWRKHKGMTLQQVADVVGTTKGQLSQIENGKSGLTPSMAEAIALAFGIDAETLRSRKPDQQFLLEDELLELFRTASTDAQKAMLASVRAIAELSRAQG